MPRPPSFADKPTLTGELVLLRPVQAADAAGLAAVDAETLRLTGSHLTASLAELERWYGSRAGHDDRIDLSIIDRATGQWAGEVVLNELDPHNRSCGFRILLGSARARGRGLGTEATRLVLAHAFEQAGVHRVELEVYDFNPRARHVYTKVGFRHEGTKRHALYWDGEWVDAHLMSILSSEWQAHRGHPAAAR
ncbi:MAG TPA: GNAT family protein [Streptosporangiaceae bacterium]|jgi:RimJ/RimL family protein N-acetyltransferase